MRTCSTSLSTAPASLSTVTWFGFTDGAAAMAARNAARSSRWSAMKAVNPVSSSVARTVSRCSLPCSHSVPSVATPTWRPCSERRSAIWSYACEIRCSLPDAGREDPQTSIATPLITSAPAMSPRKSRSPMSLTGWLTRFVTLWSVIITEKSFTGSPTER